MANKAVSSKRRGVLRPSGGAGGGQARCPGPYWRHRSLVHQWGGTVARQAQKGGRGGCCGLARRLVGTTRPETRQRNYLGCGFAALSTHHKGWGSSKCNSRGEEGPRRDAPVGEGRHGRGGRREGGGDD